MSFLRCFSCLTLRSLVSSSRPVTLAVTLALLLTLGGFGCKTSTEDDDTTSTFVRVTDMTSEQGGVGGVEAGIDLFSDVCSTDPNVPDVCFVFNDNGVVTLSAQPKDLTQLVSPVDDIIFDRYRVTYIRADGRNVPGVDVPYPFDGSANFRLPVGGSVTRAFMVVRQQAKLEAPLRQLRSLGGAELIHTIAQIDFYGADVAGRELKVTGYLNINFGDF